MKSPRMTGLAWACAAGCIAASLLTASARADGNGRRGQDADLPHYDKVVLVIEENQQYDTIIGNSAAPYTNRLAARGALMTQSYGAEHPSQPNYLDLFSGSDQNVYGDALITNFPFSTENLGAQLLHAGLTFAGFSEDLPYAGDNTDANAAGTGPHANPADYARKHNPWNDAFPATPYNYGSNYLPSYTNQTLAPFSSISAIGDFRRLPTLSIVVPNQQHDDHGVSGGAQGNALIADGDAWLKTNLSAYAEWAKRHNSLLIVTWDEDDFSSINRIATIFYGAHIRSGRYAEPQLISYTSVVNSDGQPSGPPQYVPLQGINHWNVLRTIEAIYHLGAVGQANKVKPITDIFQGSSRPQQRRTAWAGRGSAHYNSEPLNITNVWGREASPGVRLYGAPSRPACQQRRGESGPLGLQRPACRRLAGAAIPIGGVG